MLNKRISKVMSGGLCLLLLLTSVFIHGGHLVKAEELVGTRLGLHVTAEELAVWRERAVNGPYKTAEDVSPNSPGDWDRIVSNKDKFMENPESGLWGGPATPLEPGPLQPNGGDPTGSAVGRAQRVRDAAFYALVKEELDIAKEAKAAILSQFDLTVFPKLDFGNRAYWAKGVVYDINPNFLISEWLMDYIFAMDYLEILDPNIFSPDERETLLHNFERFADMADHDTNYSFDSVFVDRYSNDYTIAIGDPALKGIPYYGQEQQFGTINRRYNNRRMVMNTYVGLVGVHQNIDRYKDSAKRIVKEYVMFGVYPDGYTADFERWTDPAGACKSISYAASMLGAVITVADLFARQGDPSLFEFVTAADTPGANGSDGEGKSIKYAMESLSKYMDGTFERYGTDKEEFAGDPQYRIDGRYKDGRQDMSDFKFLMGNVYYQDEYLKSVYMRQEPGSYPYGTHIQQLSLQGHGAIYPGVAFMFGQMEGVAYPKKPAPLQIPTPVPTEGASAENSEGPVAEPLAEPIAEQIVEAESSSPSIGWVIVIIVILAGGVALLLFRIRGNKGHKKL